MDGKCIRNSGFNYWNDPLQNLHGISGRVPVRFSDFLDTTIRFKYDIQKEMKTGDILLQIGFVPTLSVDKERFIHEQGLAVTIVVQKNDVTLVISNFGVNLKEERLSGNGIGTTFEGMLVMRKESQHISLYLNANDIEKLLHERQELDMSYTRVPDDKYIHTFEYIYNNVEDLWPIFNVCDEKNAVVLISSTLFYEPSCNKNLYISKDGQYIVNSRGRRFHECGQTLSKVEPVNTTFKFAGSEYPLYSFNPFMFRLKNFNFSFDLELSKGFISKTNSTVVFQLRIESKEGKFLIGFALAENFFEVIYWYGNSTGAIDHLPLKNSSDFKRLTFSIVVNYHLQTVKTDLLDLSENKRYSHEFSNVVFQIHPPFIYIGMTNEAIIKACFH